MVEHFVANEKVDGSNPFYRSSEVYTLWMTQRTLLASCVNSTWFESTIDSKKCEYGIMAVHCPSKSGISVRFRVLAGQHDNCFHVALTVSR